MLHAPGIPHLPVSPRLRGAPRRGDTALDRPGGAQESAGTAAEDALSAAADPCAALLLLLAREVPAVELTRVVDLVEPHLRTDLRPALTSALQVHALLDEHRRREQQLAALYASASDLSSLHDLEEVLQAIVRRARDLLGTDVAYLTLSDADRAATYMRVTEGIRTEAFKQVLLPLGAGLGGLVAATCTPYATADYQSDARFVHTIDDTVAGEGLVAILGVPLRLGERVIGVLYAANRRERPFSPAEVALLLSLADHAAVAIENASLFEELRTTLSELQRTGALLQAHTASVERAAAEHERLSAVLLSGGGLTGVASAVIDVLGGSLLVVDPAGRQLARAGPELTHGAELVASVLPGAPGRRPLLSRDTEDGPVTVVPVFAGTETLGAMVSVGPVLDDLGVRTLERASVVTALLLLQERSIAEAEHRVRGELFDDLFAVPQRHPEGLHRRAAHVGLDLTCSFVVVVARIADQDSAARAWRSVRRSHGAPGVTGQHRGDLVLFVAADDAADTARRVAAELREAVGTPVTIGVAGPGTGPEELAQLYREACRCCEVLLSLGRCGEAASRDELGVYGLLLSGAGPDEVDRFVTRTVGPLQDYDRERGSDLLRTLTAYYDAGGNITRTAQDLFVHVNTLYQRLERITQVLGEGWRAGDRALQVHLALQLHNTRS